MLLVDILLALAAVAVVVAMFIPPLTRVLLANETHRKEPDADTTDVL